jgi:dephospho-CoA kinase
MKIAFVGPAAVGKDAVSNYIANKFNLTHISSGDIVRNYVKENNLGELDRKNLQTVANKLRNEQGGDILVRIALEKNPKDVIVSGLRAIDEIDTFEKLGGRVIAITAPLEKRYELAKLRGRIGDDISFEKFKKIEDEEYTSQDKNGQNISEVVSMADIEVSNDGTLQELFDKCEKIVKNL